jgi:16S rRNA (guanine527-N7)-methyltransferase
VSLDLPYMNPANDALGLALAEAQRIGALGPQPVDESIEHAMAYVRCVDAGDRSLIDLGSGGGLPGLVLAVHCPGLERIVLIDRRAKRTDLLRRLVGRLGLRDRVSVVTDDVFRYGRTAGVAGEFDLVSARSFGTPLLLAQAAFPLLGGSGRLMVSEPPESTGERWKLAEIAALFHVKHVSGGLAVLSKASIVPAHAQSEPIS